MSLSNQTLYVQHTMIGYMTEEVNRPARHKGQGASHQSARGFTPDSAWFARKQNADRCCISKSEIFLSTLVHVRIVYCQY